MTQQQMAMDLVGRKIEATLKAKGTEKERNSNYFVEDLVIEGDSHYFKLIGIVGRKLKVNISDIRSWCFLDTEVEAQARRCAKLMKSISEKDVDVDNEMYKTIEGVYKESKDKLTEERKAKANQYRQDYNEGELHVFYDIQHGNMVDNYKTLEEIEKMKKSFAKRDMLRGETILTNLQAFDAEGNLVIDEWIV